MAESSESLTDGERRFWWSIIPVLTAVSIGKAIRLPNYKSAIQAQIDYRFGFVKRGMYGEIFTRPLHLEHYHRYVVFSWLTLALMVAVLLLLTWRSGLRERLLTGEAAALFFSSYSLTYMSHMVGYFEVILALLTMGLLFVRSVRWRFLLSLPVAVFALTLHEMFLIVFLPVLLFSFLAQAVRVEECEPSSPPSFSESPRAAFAAFALLSLVCVAVTLKLSLKPAMTQAQINVMGADIAKRVDFPLDAAEPMYAVLMRSTKDNLVIMKGVAQTPAWWRQQIVCLFTMAPTIALLLLTALRVLRSNTMPAPRWLLQSAVAAGLAPLAMHLLGYDVARFNAMVILASFLVLLAACRFTTGKPIALSTRMRHCVLLVMLLNMASGDLLMDGRLARPFPFVRDLPKLWALRNGHWSIPDPHLKPQY
jgi:hypothetical protein